MKCAACGKEIKNPHYIGGVAYGYNCYKMELAILYKKWEDERNADYSVKCFSAMQLFSTKKSNSFHDSILTQWNDCKKLTAKQLDCIVKGFTFSETIEFYKIWFTLASDDYKKSISSWAITTIQKEEAFGKFINDELICDIIKNDHDYNNGFYFFSDVEIEPEKIYICKSGNYIGRNPETKEKMYNTINLDNAKNDKFVEIIKIIE